MMSGNASAQAGRTFSMAFARGLKRIAEKKLLPVDCALGALPVRGLCLDFDEVQQCVALRCRQIPTS